MAYKIQIFTVSLTAILMMAWGSTTPVSAKTPDTPAPTSTGSPTMSTMGTGGGWCC